MMNYIRNVELTVKAGKSTELLKVLNTDLLPVLKKQAGFKHEVAMVNGGRAVGISVWADKASADRYHTKVFPEVLKKLSPFIDGTPQIHNFELTATTMAA